jgi:N-acetyl-anhydromuramyl-L-alanine amidase AmpD
VIEVLFVVLHYTAGDLDRAIEVFRDPKRKVSCHLLIAEDGEVFELVPCLTGSPLKAAHAGVSRWQANGREWTNFNDISIGVELVNPNGNLLDYSDFQYRSLAVLMKDLKQCFPALRDPNRVLGHEHIAGRRGKADPGHCFQWPRFFDECYKGSQVPTRTPVCPEALRTALHKFLAVRPHDRDERVKFWHALSAVTEASIALLHEQDQV